MSRYIPHSRSRNQAVGELRASSDRYITVPGFIGSTGEAEVSATVPTWLLVAGAAGAAWYFTKKKK